MLAKRMEAAYVAQTTAGKRLGKPGTFLIQELQQAELRQSSLPPQQFYNT